MALPKPWVESSNLFTRSSKFKPSQVIAKAFLILGRSGKSEEIMIYKITAYDGDNILSKSENVFI